MPDLNECCQMMVKRYDALLARRSNFETLWEEIADYMVPRKRDVISRTFQGEKQTVRIYDGTALGALEVAVSAIDGTMTPSTIRWFSLRIHEEGFEVENDELSKFSDFIFMVLNDSNFKAEMQEVYEDLLAFGTSCLFIDEDDSSFTEGFGGIRFQAIPPGYYVIAEDGRGYVDTVMREFTLSVRAVVDRWGIENVSDGLKNKYKNGKLDDEVHIIHGVTPKRGLPEEIKNEVDDEHDYASMYMERGGRGGRNSQMLEVGGYRTFPYIVARWRKTSGEEYGRGPGMAALPDVRTLNEAVKLRLQQWQLAVRPPIGLSDRSVMGQPNLTPGSINTFKGSPRDAFSELVTTARFDVASFQESQLQGAIRSRFFVDQIQFPPMEGTPVTATEFAGRFEVMQRILGPILGRMEHELLTFLLRRVFDILVEGRRRDVTDLVDVELLKQERVRVVFEGPLARTQRGSDIEAVSRAVSVLLPMVEIKPEVLDALDWDKIAKFIPERSGVPAHLIRNDEDIARIQQGRQQAQEQMAQQQQMESQTQALSNIAPLAQTVNQLGQQEAVPAGV